MATAKKTTKKPAVKAVTEPETPTKKNSSTPALKVKKSYVIAVLAVIIIAGLLYALKSWFVVAMVNGQPISRMTYTAEMERQAGKQTMNTLVTKALIFQEASKRGINVTDGEVNSEINKIDENMKQQGQRLDQVLALQGMTREQLVEQVKLQKLLEKMVGKNVTVSDKEVDDYIAANKDQLPQDTDEATLKKSSKERLQQQKTNEQIQKLLESLQKNAKITYFVTM